MQKWEYLDRYIVNHNAEFFGSLGRQGWELVAIDNRIAYFKRPISEPNAFSVDLETGKRTPIGVVGEK